MGVNDVLLEEWDFEVYDRSVVAGRVTTDRIPGLLSRLSEAAVGRNAVVFRSRVDGHTMWTTVGGNGVD